MGRRGEGSDRRSTLMDTRVGGVGGESLTGDTGVAKYVWHDGMRLKCFNNRQKGTDR